MSGLYENQKTIRQIKSMIQDNRPKDGEATYYFVLGYPRSNIGKGTLVAQLLNASPNSHAIKFDGLLNTNENGRPNLSYFVENKIHEMWQKFGKPRHFYIEIGGLITDRK